MGKIAISDLILLKPGKLTPEEFESMKAHARLGMQSLSGGRFPLLQSAEQIALTSERPYKRAWSPDEAIDEIKRQSGCQFDPRVVEAFLKVVDH